MLEFGQPLHAFDALKVQGGINVRLAQPNEKFLALDGRTYQLDEKMLLIADVERAVAIGGVMDGEDSGVTETTRTVLLESAYFLPSSIRRTARNLSLPSDASDRFARGVGPEMILRASARATQLFTEIPGSTAPRKRLGSATCAEPPPVSRVRGRFAGCRRCCGTATGSRLRSIRSPGAASPR